MSLIRIEYGSLASSQDMNHNFEYLEDIISSLSSNITDKTSSFSSTVQTLNRSVQELLNYRASFVSVGVILPYAGDVIPDGYLLCDGSEVLVEDFPELHNVIGYLYGSSDSTSFCLPDMKDKTLWGVGEHNLAEYITSKLPNIKGQFRLVGTEGSSAVSGAFSASTKGGSYGQGHEPSASNPLMKFDASRSNNIYDSNCSIVQPPSIAVQFIIKY